MKKYILLFLLLQTAVKGFSQDTDIAYYVTLNANLYVPGSDSQKGIYPVVWYDKETDPKVLVGGFGVGFAALKDFKPKIRLKGQANISKNTYWDESVLMRDPNGFEIIPFHSGTSDIVLGLTATANYSLSEKFSIGTGLGAQVLLVSLTRQPDTQDSKNNFARNRYYKPVMPTVPFEIIYKVKNKLFQVRYEHGLLNRYKGDLKEYKDERFGLLFFEVGFEI